MLQGGTPAAEVDVVVVGSGGAGLAAALAAASSGASVAILERSSHVGGTTAVSGGVAWLPGNRHAAAIGAEDSRADALRYILDLAGGDAPAPELVEAFVDAAPAALEELEASSPLRMQAPYWYADYYAPRPGGRRRGRSLEPVPYRLSRLGAWADRVRRSPTFPALTFEETTSAAAESVPPDSALAASRASSGIATRGVALVGALLEGVLAAGVEPELDVRATSLVRGEDGGVEGIRGERHGTPFDVRARCGVILACGGYEWNAKLVRAFLGGEVAPMSPPFNTGDALLMAMSAGAALANMHAAWWYPAVCDPSRVYEGERLVLMDYTRTLAGAIVVNHRGRRFANEGVCYADLPRSFRHYDPVAREYPNAEPWLVFDESVRRSTTVAGVGPEDSTPDWLATAGTLAELASMIGVDGRVLKETVGRFNADAERGEDRDHGRGTHWWEGWSRGGPDPARNLGPVGKPPFYALRVLRAVIGTSGGPVTDSEGRVLDQCGAPIPGLLAAGNACASAFGTAYPGAGATLGLALTFGVIAGRTAARGGAPAVTIGAEA